METPALEEEVFTIREALFGRGAAKHDKSDAALGLDDLSAMTNDFRGFH